MREKIVFCILSLMVFAAQSQEKLLDFWDEEIRLFGVAKLNENVDNNLSDRRDINYISKYFTLDHSTKKVGDLSVLYTVKESEKSSKFGFIASLWQNYGRDIKESYTLKFWLKTEGNNLSSKWKVVLIDNNGLKANGIISKTNALNEWKLISLKLKKLKAPKKFNWSSIKMCEFDVSFEENTKIWLDGILFEGKEKTIGISDKSISQRISEAEKSKSIRVKNALLEASKSGEPNESPTLEYVVSAFAKMILNEDLENANKILQENDN